MKVELTRDTAVRFAKGTVLEVSDQEASRLIAFNNAVEVKAAEAKPAKKKTTKKRQHNSKTGLLANSPISIGIAYSKSQTTQHATHQAHASHCSPSKFPT